MDFEKIKLLIRKFRNDHPFVFYFMVIYLGGLLIYISIFLLFFADYSSAMKLNEIGDFLAGSFSPLAFIFLILGYIQNNKNLAQNTAALKQQAIALQQQSISLNQQAKALDTQIAELKLSNQAYQRQVDEMEKSVEAQQNMFQLAERQYLESNEEKLKSFMPILNLIGTQYLTGLDYGHSNLHDHRFNLTLKIQNHSIKNLKIKSNFWYITKSGGSYDNSLTVSMDSLDINQSQVLMFYVKTDIIPFQNNTLSFDYYDHQNLKYSKIYRIYKNVDDFVLFEEIPS